MTDQPYAPLPLCTAAETRALDAAIIASGIPGIQLMKRAARAALRHILATDHEPESKLADWLSDSVRAAMLEAQRTYRPELLVLCGKGNNAGDGYLLAALAREQQLKVSVITVCDPADLQGDARTAYEYAVQAGVRIDPWQPGMVLPEDVMLIDALLGTGAQGAPRGAIAEAIDAINERGSDVLALDIPSGLDPDTGHAPGAVVRADRTVTFITRKRGLYTGEGVEVAGLICHEPLVDRLPALPKTCVELDTWLDCYFFRPRNAHKGMFGHVMVIGGDTGMGGAVLLASEAAARCGAGLTSAATRPEHVAALLARRPEVMAAGVTSGQTLEPLLERPTVLVVGPGLGRSAWSEQMLQQATLTGKPLVLDADALNILAEGRVVRDRRRDNWVLTPHPAEAARLLGITTAEVQADRFAAVQALQQRYGGAVVLKGAGSLVCGDDGVIHLCTAGNPAMASGGMGDVLAGIIGSLMAQGSDPLQAARVGVRLHAVAGDYVASNRGRHGGRETDGCVGLLAGDLLDVLGPIRSGWLTWPRKPVVNWDPVVR